MSEKIKNFRQHLDDLVFLFKKFKEKFEAENLIGFEKNIFQNIELIVNNYDSIKNSIPDSLIEQLSGPLQKMMLELISRLKEQLDVDIPTTNKADDVLSNKKRDLKNDIEEIDEMLRRPNLSIDEINGLLDKRIKTEK